MVNIMVKIRKSHLKTNSFRSSDEMKTDLLNRLIDLSERNLSEFIKALIEFEFLSNTSKPIKDAYVILTTCFYLQEQNHFKPFTSDLKEKCKKAIKSIIQYHNKNFKLNKSCLGFKLTQSILNTTSAIIIPYLNSDYSNLKIVLCAQILKSHCGLSFELLMSALIKLLNGQQFVNLFSLLINPNPPFLPARNNFEYTIVLDLDETLGHFDGENFNSRPWAEWFIQGLSKNFEVVLFTSALEEYANYAMKVVDKNDLVALRLFRQHLRFIDGRPVKDLKILGRCLEKIIIIDNQQSNFELQPDNGIQIKSWTSDELDLELKILFELIVEYLTPNVLTSFAVEQILMMKMLNKNLE